MLHIKNSLSIDPNDDSEANCYYITLKIHGDFVKQYEKTYKEEPKVSIIISDKNNMGTKETATVQQLGLALSLVPMQAQIVDLLYLRLPTFKATDLATIFAALPEHVTCFILQSNDLSRNTVEDWIIIFQSLPTSVTTLILDHKSTEKIRQNQNEFSENLLPILKNVLNNPLATLVMEYTASSFCFWTSPNPTKDKDNNPALLVRCSV